ncbi:MAG: hypothetical protein Q4F57_02380, partial [Weeksellaceae bacterium]|nr:hypothetical protein [Weeksellaceae bacterium]
HINHHGTFRIRGYITPNFTNTGQMSTYFAPQIKFNGQLIWIAQTPAHILFDFTVNSLPNQTNVLEFSMFTGNIGDDYALLAEIIPLTLLDEEGNPYPALADLTNYQLATLLPDITFGQFVRLTKNLFNLNLDLRNDKEIHMDYTQSGFDTTNVADMSQYEVQNPERTYHQDLSFLLSYAEVAESEDTNYQLFYNRNGSATQNFIATESTKEIDIAAVPLQFHNRNNLYTAHQKAESSTVMHIASYAGLSNGLNTTLSADRWRLDVIFQKYWRRWLYHRVHSSSVKWNFVTLKNHIKNLHILQVIHAYNCRMFIKNITKTSRNARVYEVEIETDVVKD